MIIDTDCHISARETGFEIGVNELLRRMDASGVDRAVCWPHVAYDREIAADNAAIHRGARTHPDRIIAFAGVNPRLGLRAVADELERCLEQYGVRGIKLNGARDDYPIDDPALALPLVERIAAAGVVLAVHCGPPDVEKTHPHRLARLLSLFPSLRMLIIHMGGSGVPDLNAAVVDLAQRFANCWLVDSEADYRQAQRAVAALGAERLCYGSDTPFCEMRFELGIRRVVYQDLSPTEREAILGGNAARILGL
jgi:hypothetical protein